MVELSDSTDVIMSPTDQMAKTNTDSLNFHLDIARGKTGLHALRSTLTTT
jgi:hypothetical protein